MNKLATKKNVAHVKARLIMLAKRRLGLTQHKNYVLFNHLAKHYGESRGQTKAQALELVRRYVAEHKGTPLPTKASKRHVTPSVATLSTRAQSDAFLASYEWRTLRMRVIVARGARCECCGASPQMDSSVVINVDHIRPRRDFPELALDESNLQVLCAPCNHGKGNWDRTDWRVDPMRPRLVKKG